MKPHLYTRKGKTIIMVAIPLDHEEPREQFKSINKAKRRSRELQMQHDGALGLGSVRRG